MSEDAATATRTRLLDWQHGQTRSERLATQLVAAEGYTSVDPAHPLGGKDGGADAILNRDGQRWIMAAYFPRGQQAIKTITDKFLDDLDGVAAKSAVGMAFVTNQELRLAERAALEAQAGCAIDLIHLERAVHILCTPQMHGARYDMLGIERHTPLNTSEYAALAVRESRARCEARWIAVGLQPGDARALADSDIGTPPEELLPTAEQRVVVWSASMGAGKSIAADRAHQHALAQLERDLDAPLPVFIKASELKIALMDAVRHRLEEIGDPRRAGAAIVIDGLDEAGHESAAMILEQARVLAQAWPSTTVVLTTRALPLLAHVPEHQLLPPLSTDQQLTCVRLGLGEQRPSLVISDFPAAIRETLEQPFFALLTGVWMRDNHGHPQDPVELLKWIGERATRTVGASAAALRRLATMSVGRELGPVLTCDVATSDELPSLLATGMVRSTSAQLQYTLPAIAQWFAAQAILLEEVSLEALSDVPEDLELWLHPLALALTSGSTEQAARIATELLRMQPAFAFAVCSTAFKPHRDAAGTPPPWRVAASELERSLQTIADALGPASQLVLDVDERGEVGPVALVRDDDGIMVAHYVGREPREKVFQPTEPIRPFHADPQWGGIRSGPIGPTAAWAWQWTHAELISGFNNLLDKRRIPILPGTPLAHEAAWECCLDLIDSNILNYDTVVLDDALERLAVFPTDRGRLVWSRHRSAPSHDVGAVRHHLEQLRADGCTTISSPVPGRDVDEPSATTGGFFSDERLIEIARSAYEQALVSYRAVVERWFVHLAPRLEHYVLLPTRIHGRIKRHRDGAGSYPYLDGYWEPLPNGHADELAFVYTEDRDTRADVRQIWRQHQAARPHAARWLSGSAGGMSFEVARPFVMSEIVYEWLASDLRRLGLLTTMTHVRSGGSLNIWADEPAG